MYKSHVKKYFYLYLLILFQFKWIIYSNPTVSAYLLLIFGRIQDLDIHWSSHGRYFSTNDSSIFVNSFLLENSSWTSVYSNCYRRNRGLVLKVAYKQINNELLLCNLDFLSWFWVQNGVVPVIFSSNLDICHLMNLIFMKQKVLLSW